MKPESEFEPEESLIEAALQDESWQASNAALKAEALKAFQRRHRARRLIWWAGSVAVVAIGAGVAVHWLARPAHLVPGPEPRPAQLLTSTNSPPTQLTDQQLLACFPTGTCFIAEVDGEKRLVFYSPDTEHAFVAQPAVPAH
jgi:hypothetical protein